MTAARKWLPPDAMAELLPEHEAALFLDEFLPRWSRVFGDARKVRDTLPAVDEDKLLAEFAKLLLDMLQGLGTRWAVTTRHVASRGLRELFETEATPALEPDRRFLLRQLEYALNFYADLQEAAALELERLPADALTQLLSVLSPTDMMASPSDTLALRWQVDLFLALDSVNSDLEELRFWSDRAVLGARKVRAVTGSSPALAMRADLIRQRAKNVWHDWDDDDVAREVAPWPESQ